MRKKMLAVLLSLVTILSVSGCSDKNESDTSVNQSDGETVEFRVASVVSQSAKDASDEFTKEVDEKTNGRIKVTFFHDNMLGDDKSVVESTQHGDIDMAISPITPLAAFFNDFYLFDAPFVFSEYQEVYDVLDGEIGQQMAKDLESYNLKCLGFGENGFRYLTNSKYPVKLPEDLNGLKIRVMENDIQLATWEALGANPTPISFSELYTALQQKTVDGEENSLGIIDSSQFMTVQKYLTLDKHTYVPFVFCMNLDKFNALSEEDQQIILDAGKNWVNSQRQYSQKYDEEILNKYKSTDGIEVIDVTDEDRKSWRKEIENSDVYEMIKEKLSHPEYLDQIM